jgi:hypothetical protein
LLNSYCYQVSLSKTPSCNPTCFSWMHKGESLNWEANLQLTSIPSEWLTCLVTWGAIHCQYCRVGDRDSNLQSLPARSRNARFRRAS